MSETKGAYARQTEIHRDEIRERRGQSHERWTARKVAVGCDDFWKARNFNRPATLPGTWSFEEKDYVRRWVSKPQQPVPHLTIPKPESFLDMVRRTVRERREAEQNEKLWQEEFERDMREIERERSLAARRAAGLVRVRKNKRDATQGNVAQSRGMPAGTPPG
jgi:hypothetical protein